MIAISVINYQMKKKKRTQRIRMSKETCVDSLMMEMRKKRQNQKKVQVQQGVTQKKK